MFYYNDYWFFCKALKKDTALGFCIFTLVVVILAGGGAAVGGAWGSLRAPVVPSMVQMGRVPIHGHCSTNPRHPLQHHPPAKIPL